MALSWGRRKHWAIGIILVLGLSNQFAGIARSAPILQLYAEGATYDIVTESWVLNVHTATSIRIWAIGNVNGPGGKGTISNVKLAVAYSAAEAGLIIHLDSSTTGGYGGFTDPSTPEAPQHLQTQTDGSIRPLLSGGKPIAPHGIYNSSNQWQEFLLGDFTKQDSPIADFINTFPTAPSTTQGQINVYEVALSGGSGGPVSLHFDLYDSIQSKNNSRAVFSPFSHDATTHANPEPSSIALALSGLLGAGVARWRRKRPQP